MSMGRRRYPTETRNLEPVGEAWCRCDEVTGARRGQPFGMQRGGQGVANALQPGCVPSGCHQRRDAGVA